jgi:hypothetical protein
VSQRHFYTGDFRGFRCWGRSNFEDALSKVEQEVNLLQKKKNLTGRGEKLPEQLEGRCFHFDG